MQLVVHECTLRKNTYHGLRDGMISHHTQRVGLKHIANSLDLEISDDLCEETHPYVHSVFN
jgi:hypothetical protein